MGDYPISFLPGAGGAAPSSLSRRAVQKNSRRWHWRRAAAILLLGGASMGAAESTTRQISNPRLHGAKEVATLSSRGNLQDAPAPSEVSFLPVVCASLFNSVANIIRPDAAIIWQVSIVGGCMHHAPLLTPLYARFILLRN